MTLQPTAPLPLDDQDNLISDQDDLVYQSQLERQLYQELKTKEREQLILLKVLQTLASALELQPSLILDQLRLIVDYDQAGLFILDDSLLVPLALRSSKGLQQTSYPQISLNSPYTIIKLFNENKVIRIGDINSKAPAAQFLHTLFIKHNTLFLQGIQSWMWIPVAVKGQVIGMIGLAHQLPNYFTAHHADLALTVANQAAITMVNAKLYENAQALAVQHERQRLAQELHDAVNQSLFSAGLIAEVLPRLWERDINSGKRSLEDLRRLIRGALAEMRMLLVELRPSALTNNDLSELLHLLGKALTGRNNVPVNIMVDGTIDLPDEVKIIFYRLCQEALNNISKDAAATQVDIHLRYDAKNKTVEMHIRDNGRGFDPSHIPSGHYGLSMMHERATAVKALLTITSQPGQGSSIILCWPNTTREEEMKC